MTKRKVGARVPQSTAEGGITGDITPGRRRIEASDQEIGTVLAQIASKDISTSAQIDAALRPHQIKGKSCRSSLFPSTGRGCGRIQLSGALQPQRPELRSTAELSRH